jgi:hypothetical protein
MACLEYFNSTAAFDRHRIGAAAERRCLTVTEMTVRGMACNGSGFWITRPMARPALPQAQISGDLTSPLVQVAGQSDRRSQRAQEVSR